MTKKITSPEKGTEKGMLAIEKGEFHFWLEKSKLYFWYFLGVMGIVFFWAGIWDGLGGLPYLSTPWISLLIGLLMLLVSKTISKGVVAKKVKQELGPVLSKIHHHPQKHEFNIKYNDKLKNKGMAIKAGKIKRIEKEFLVLIDQGRELFIPFHRITEIRHKDKIHWKG
ncbi:MAG: RNA repair domain-containing protein [Nanoarchaeota archaeon]